MNHHRDDIAAELIVGGVIVVAILAGFASVALGWLW